MIKALLEELKPGESTDKDIRKFALTLGVILAILGGYLLYKERMTFQISWIAGLVLIIVAISMPKVLKPLYKAWMILANILALIMTRIILGLLYFIIFMPIGVILKLFGERFINLKWKLTNPSYWNYLASEHKDSDRYLKQF